MTAPLHKRREQLLAREAEITGHLRSIEAALEERPDPDAEERATEREGDEVLERLGSAEQAELARIHAALARMDEGCYGVCVSCGEVISEERLDLVPSTPFCRRCAK